MQYLKEQGLEIPSETRKEIKHFTIDFVPMINKIKIDLLMKRKANELTYTQYLNGINMTPQEFDCIDDLFLAELFSYNESNLDFFK